MNTITNQPFFWTNHSSVTLDGPEKFSFGPIVPQVGKPEDFATLLQRSATSSNLENFYGKRVATARVASDEVAPFVWADDEPDAEDEIFNFPVEKVTVRARVVRVEQAPLVFHDDEPLCEDEISFPPLQSVRARGRIVRVGDAPLQFEPDEARTGS